MYVCMCMSVLTALAPLRFEVAKPPFSPLRMLMANPMMLVMVFMLIVVLVMPKLLQGMSPEVGQLSPCDRMLHACIYVCMYVCGLRVSANVWLSVPLSIVWWFLVVGVAGVAEAVSERRGGRRSHEEPAEAHGHGRRCGGRR